jgi:ATP-binding cassette subfamily B protein
MMAAVKSSELMLYRRLLQQARPYWPHIVGIFLIDLLATPLALLGPLPLKIAVDTVVGADPLPAFLAAVLPDAVTQSGFRLLVMAATLQVVVVLLGQLQGLGSHVLRTHTGEGLTHGFRSLLLRHLQRLAF